MRKYLRPYTQARIAERAAFLNAVKSAPCVDCGRTYPPYVMDFDHVVGGKVSGVGSMRCHSMARLIAEIAKCEVVCANCHRERTFGRKQRERVMQEVEE
jgi:hypothetical protein